MECLGVVLRELYTHVCFIDPTYLAIYVVLYDDTYVLTFHLCCVDTHHCAPSESRLLARYSRYTV